MVTSRRRSVFSNPFRSLALSASPRTASGCSVSIGSLFPVYEMCASPLREAATKKPLIWLASREKHGAFVSLCAAFPVSQGAKLREGCARHATQPLLSLTRRPAASLSPVPTRSSLFLFTGLIFRANLWLSGFLRAALFSIHCTRIGHERRTSSNLLLKSPSCLRLSVNAVVRANGGKDEE